MTPAAGNRRSMALGILLAIMVLVISGVVAFPAAIKDLQSHPTPTVVVRATVTPVG